MDEGTEVEGAKGEGEGGSKGDGSGPSKGNGEGALMNGHSKGEEGGGIKSSEAQGTKGTQGTGEAKEKGGARRPQRLFAWGATSGDLLEGSPISILLRRKLKARHSATRTEGQVRTDATCSTTVAHSDSKAFSHATPPVALCVAFSFLCRHFSNNER